MAFSPPINKCVKLASSMIYDKCSLVELSGIGTTLKPKARQQRSTAALSYWLKESIPKVRSLFLIKI